MKSEDYSVTEKLLPTCDNMNNAVIENEKGDKATDKELDLRLHDAVCDPENIEEIETLIEEEPQLLFERDKNNGTALHTLAIDADEMAPQISKILLGVTESEDGKTVISIERPDLINLQDSDAFTALHYAAINRQPELVKALLKWGADPYLQDKMGNTPLHISAEGMNESAIDCAKQLLKFDTRKSLMMMKNNEEKTPLHKAADKKSVKFVEFLLKPENRYDLSLKDQNGKNILHYVCSVTEESNDLCQIVKAIVHRCGATHLNAQDNLERTPLHLASVQRLPQITSILVNEDKTDVVKVDKAGKTALHYACQNGCYPTGHQCVEILIGRKMPERMDLVKYLYKTEDNQGQTAFMYACINCPPSTVQKYLTIVPHPQYWLTGTYSTLLYKHSPLALTALMDKSFSEDKTRTTESEDVILVDYGPISGYLDPVDLEPQQETKYLKQALYWEYETQRAVLLHPLPQLFIYMMIWLAAFTTLVLSFYSGKDHSKPLAFVASGVMLIYILTSLINEAFEIYTVKLFYLTSLTNLTQVAQILLAFIAIVPVLSGAEEAHAWQKYVTATGILLAYILSMRDIGKLHNKIGLVVEVLKQVLIQIVQVLLSCSPLWIGFTLAFVIIFDDEESLNSSFPGPIVKVLVMMTGEFEYNDTFNEDGEKNAMASYRAVRLIFFLSFLISVPVAFFNLLTGFALDKVMELRERAKVGRIAKQLEHIYFIESILLTLRPLRKILPHETVISWLRKLNVTTAWLDQNWKFFTTIREKIRKSEKRIVKKRTLEKCFSCRDFSFCQGKLPHEVEEQIYALASSTSKLPTFDEKCVLCHK